jgi:hypothetical protein
VKVFFVCYSQLVTRYFLYATLDIGEEVIDIDTPQRRSSVLPTGPLHTSRPRPSRGTWSTITPRGVSKNCINVVFHEGGIPSKRTHLVMSLDQGGKALKVEWKLSKHLFTDKQAMAQAIPKDSAWYNGCADTLDCKHQARVMPIGKFYQGAPQRIALDRECTGNPAPIAGVYSPTRWYNTRAKTTYSSTPCM